jgi:branched-chain amino acid transport system substrate-binding protein
LKKILFIALAVALALSVGLIGCEGEGEPQQYIRIGTITYTEGMYAGFGGAGIWGTEAAIEDINDAGGVDVDGVNYLLQLYKRESLSDETSVAGHTEYLIDTNDVHAIVIPCIPPPMVAPMVPVVEAAEIPLVAFPAPYEPWLGMIAEYSHNYTFTSNFHIATPLDPDVPGYLIKDIGFEFFDAVGVTNETGEVVGVFASNDGDGKGWYELMGAMLEDAGYTTSAWEVDEHGAGIGTGLFPMDTVDYSAITSEWVSDNVTILWGNCPAPHFKDLWTQAYAAGLRPKVIFGARAALFWTDQTALIGPPDLATGVGLENWWHNEYDPLVCPGVGTTTPQSLYERWVADSGEQLNPNIGWGYAKVQVIVDAIERAGSLDGAAIRDALETTDLDTIAYKINYDEENHSSPAPLYYFQWFWDEDEETVVLKVVVCKHDFLDTTGEAFLIEYSE